MAKKKEKKKWEPPFGKCFLCGKESRLTLEHLPPQKTFNITKKLIIETDKNLNRDPFGDPPNGRIMQGGFGKYSLCERCNNITGDWYVKDYDHVARQADLIIQCAQGNPKLIYPIHLRPGPFIKQVVTMFVSVLGPGFTEEYQDIREWLLDREARFQDPRIRVYMYYNPTPWSRLEPKKLCIRAGGPMSNYGEFASYPFGFVMTFESGPPDLRLMEITGFANCPYDYETYWESQVPVLLPVYNPGTWWSVDQMEFYRQQYEQQNNAK